MRSTPLRTALTLLIVVVFLSGAPAVAEPGKAVKNEQHGFVVCPPKGWKEIPVPPPSQWGSDWEDLIAEYTGEKKEDKKPKPTTEMVANFDGPQGLWYSPCLKVWRIRNVGTLEEAAGAVESNAKRNDYKTIDSVQDISVQKLKAKKYIISSEGWQQTVVVVFNHDRAFFLQYSYEKAQAKGWQKTVDESFATFVITKDAQDKGQKAATDADHSTARLPAGWSRFQSKRYNYEYNCQEKDAKIFIGYLENFITKIMDIFKVPEEERTTLDKFTVKLFNSYNDFSAYASSDGVGGAAAYFSPMQKHLVTCATYEWGGGKKEAYGVLFHEATHQFVHFYFGEETNVPIWVNEGLAEYFNAAGFKDPKNFKFGSPLYERLQDLKAAIRANETVPLKTLFQMSQSQYYAKAQLCYAQGWGIVHYFHQTKNPKYKDLFLKYCKALRAKCKGMNWEKRQEEWKKRTGSDPTDDEKDDEKSGEKGDEKDGKKSRPKYDPSFLEKEAFDEIFKDVDYDDLEKEWKEMILKVS
ncbi:MAG: DUF1570 domain-containing protein [Planctomycetota bacterium]|nr:DUF1570 domain-containing protein [Planctomycetota bacterium]